MKLVRQLQPARRHCIAKAAQLTGVGAWIAIGLFVIFVFPTRMIHSFCTSKREVAMRAIHELAHDAYAQWLARHPGAYCPHDIGELRPYVARQDLTDPWGQSYMMTCSTAVLVVSSPGEDGRYGTPDDIRSDP